MAFKTLQLRRDTAANWASVNPILASGEIGYETDTDQFKFGNGTSTWNQLTEYYKPGSGGGGSVAWGQITGTLSSQTDLQTALNGKAPTSHDHPASDIRDASAAGRSMLTAADAAAQTALLSTFTGTAKGLVPSPAGATTTFLRADGAWASAGGGGGSDPGGPDTSIQFNDNGVFGGDSGFTFDKTTKTLTLGGTISTAGATGWNRVGLNLGYETGGAGGVGVLIQAAGTTVSFLRAENASLNLGVLGFTSNPNNTSSDTYLHRDAAGTLAQRNGPNAQTFRIYNTFTDASNYERLSLGWENDAAVIKAEAGGTGTPRNIEIQTEVEVKAVRETVYTAGDLTDIDPALGGIQTVTLAANRTPTATNFADGQSVTLMIASNTFTVNWATVNPKWVGGAVPTLPASGYAVIVLWKIGTQVYGKGIGDVA